MGAYDTSRCPAHFLLIYVQEKIHPSCSKLNKSSEHAQ